MITSKQSHLHTKEEDFAAREEEPRRIPEDGQSSVLDLQASPLSLFQGNSVFSALAKALSFFPVENNEGFLGGR